MFFIVCLMISAVVISIYASKLYHDLYLKGHHNNLGRKMNLKSLKLIVTMAMSNEDKAIAIKCLKLYYCYLVIFYSSSVLILYFVIRSINY
jgi:hypothetical protein